MERLFALIDGEFKLSFDRLGIEIGLLDSPGATVDLGLGLTSPPIKEELKMIFFVQQFMIILIHYFVAETLKNIFYFVPFANLSSIVRIGAIYTH